MTVTVQLCAGARVLPQVVVERKGGPLLTRRTVTGADPAEPAFVTAKTCHAR